MLGALGMQTILSTVIKKRVWKILQWRDQWIRLNSILRMRKGKPHQTRMMRPTMWCWIVLGIRVVGLMGSV